MNREGTTLVDHVKQDCGTTVDSAALRDSGRITPQNLASDTSQGSTLSHRIKRLLANFVKALEGDGGTQYYRS